MWVIASGSFSRYYLFAASGCCLNFYCLFNFPGPTCSQNLKEFSTPSKQEQKAFKMLEHTC